MVIHLQVEAGLVLDMYQITIKQSCRKGQQVFIILLNTLVIYDVYSNCKNSVPT